MVSPIVAVAALLAILALIPTRRLVLRGVSTTTLAAYFLALWLLSVAIVAVPGRPRLLLPLVVILALVPFVTLREGVDRLLGRSAQDVSTEPRNVTPPDHASTEPEPRPR